MVEEFWDNEGGGFYFTGESHENLIVRSKDYFDNATPSGNSVAALVLLRLATLTGRENYRNLATAVLREIGDQTRRYPSGFGYALSAMDFLLSTPKEIAIVGEDIQPLLTETWRRYLPNKVVAAGVEAAELTPLLQDRPLINGLATAYVCEHFTCKQPVTEVAALREQL
jgi:uncharacterized protein YyaL (SSP411 family)